MELLNHYLPNFLFVLLRAGAVLVLLPFFGNQTLPAQFRIGIAVAVALILAPVVEAPADRTHLPLLVVREVLFGVLFGLGVRFLFYAVDAAGQVMGTGTGLSIATVFNPEIGQSTDVARLFGIIAVLLFLSLDLHHDLIAVFVKSYEWLPVGSLLDPAAMASAAVSFSGRVFVIALKISAPVVIIMLIANVLVGLIAKVVPQLNVLFVGFPVYILLGLVVMVVCMPVFLSSMGAYFSTIKDELVRLIQVIRG